ATAFRAPLAPGVVDEDAAHGLGGGGEEVAAAVPVLGLLAADQSEVGIVDEGGRLEGLPGPLLGQSCRGESAQFVVDQGQQLGGGLRVSGRRVIKEACHRGHSAEYKRAAGARVQNTRAETAPESLAGRTRAAG